MHLVKYFSFVIFMFAAGCSDIPGEPDEKSLRSAVAEHLPPAYEIESFDIVGHERLSHSTTFEPVIKTRSKATLELQDDIYVVTTALNGVSILEKVASEGDETKASFISTSTLNYDTWGVRFDRSLIETQGRPLADFSVTKHAILGSDKANALFKAEEERAAAELKLEQQRAEAELKLKRELAEKRRKEKAAERAKNLKFLAQIAGTWRCVEPMAQHGRVYQRKDDSVEHAITFTEDMPTTGRTDAAVHIVGRRPSSTEFKVKYILYPDIKTVEFTNPNRKEIYNSRGNLRWVLEGTTYAMTFRGSNMAFIVNENGWRCSMHKRN